MDVITPSQNLVKVTMIAPTLPKYAVHSKQHEDGDWRSAFRHDLHEILYRHAFRKLAQKTQVIVRPSDDSFRTRLTHTLEVANIADNFGVMLKLNTEAIAAIAYAHDLGHPPFAHVGEKTLNRLFKSFVERTLIGYHADKGERSKLLEYFGFKHSHNSRRILQRKMKGISDVTLKSVIGHSWSPWKDSSALHSLAEVKAYISKELSVQTSQFLPCYEAQVVALSDQLAGLNSDIEDLVAVLHTTDVLRAEAVKHLERTDFSAEEKKKVRDIIEKFIQSGAEVDSRKRGWGRKRRIGSTVESIVKQSKSRIQRCESWEKSPLKPLAPAPEIAVALDVVEGVVRQQVCTHHEIRLRDSFAETATSILFNRILSLTIKSDGVERLRSKEGPWGDRTPTLYDNYMNWVDEYNKEAVNETILEGAFSFPCMKQHAQNFKGGGLWDTLCNVVQVIDYISELTDRFVIYDLFRGDPLQPVLIHYFDRALEA